MNNIAVGKKYLWGCPVDHRDRGFGPQVGEIVTISAVSPTGFPGKPFKVLVTRACGSTFGWSSSQYLGEEVKS